MIYCLELCFFAIPWGENQKNAKKNVETCGCFNVFRNQFRSKKQPCLKTEIPFALQRIVLGIFSLDESRVWVIFSLKWNLLHKQAIPFQQPLFLICWVKAQGLGAKRDQRMNNMLPPCPMNLNIFLACSIPSERFAKKNTQSTVQKSHGMRGSLSPLSFTSSPCPESWCKMFNPPP